MQKKTAKVNGPQERKTFAFTVDALDVTGRTVEGYGAVFGNTDAYGDIIHKGAFAKTIAERGGKIKFLYQHEPSMVLGRVLELREDEKGLFVKAIVSDTQVGRDVLALLQDGALDGMSIGYDAIKGGVEFTESQDGSVTRNLKEIRLWEISLVTFPANELATVTALKAREDAPNYGMAQEGDPTLCGMCKHYAPTAAEAGHCALYNFEAEPDYRCSSFAHRAVVPATSHEPVQQRKRVVAPSDFPLASREREWDSAAAVNRLRTWAGGTTPDEVDFAKYRQGFLWYDADNAETFGAYKLPYVDVIDGEPQIVPRAVFAIAGVLAGARGGADIPEAEQGTIQRHVAGLYSRMAEAFDDDGIIPPWDAAADAQAEAADGKGNHTDYLTITLPADAAAALLKLLVMERLELQQAGVLHEPENLSYTIAKPSLKDDGSMVAPTSSRTERAGNLLQAVTNAILDIEIKELGDEA